MSFFLLLFLSDILTYVCTVRISIFQMTGTPLVGFKRMQFNMFLKKENKVSIMKTLNEEEKLIPLFWVEEVKKKSKCVY